MKVFIIAGESSGDLLGGKLLKCLKEEINDISVKGIGGDNLISNGLSSIFHQKEIAVNGFIEVIPHIPNILSKINETVKAILEFKPDLIITIDAPDFNFRVIKKLKNKTLNFNCKIVHYVAPTVWAYRAKRAEKIAKLYDLLLVILPFEPKYFEKYGLKTKFIGHPIFKDFNQTEIAKKSKNIIITPGSRKSEIYRFAPILKEFIYLVKSNFGNKFTINLFVTNEIKDKLYQIYNNEISKDEIKMINKESQKNEILQNCHLAILKSGTNTMEMANKSIPMIIFYKFNFLTYFILSKIYRVKVKYANLLNYQANNMIIPEFLHSRCKANLIYQEFRNYNYHDEKRNIQVDGYSKIIAKFKNPDNISPELCAVKAIKDLL